MQFLQQKDYDLVMDEEIQFVLIDSVAGNREDKVQYRFQKLCFTMLLWSYSFIITTKQTHVVYMLGTD